VPTCFKHVFGDLLGVSSVGGPRAPPENVETEIAHCAPLRQITKPFVVVWKSMFRQMEGQQTEEPYTKLCALCMSLKPKDTCRPPQRRLREALLHSGLPSKRAGREHSLFLCRLCTSNINSLVHEKSSRTMLPTATIAVGINDSSADSSCCFGRCRLENPNLARYPSGPPDGCFG
jgi:hypothetical protein